MCVEGEQTDLTPCRCRVQPAHPHGKLQEVGQVPILICLEAEALLSAHKGDLEHAPNSLA